MEGNAKLGNGMDLGCTEVRRPVVGNEGSGQGMEKAGQEQRTLRSEDSAWFPATVSTSHMGDLRERRFQERMERRMGGIGMRKRADAPLIH